MQPRQAHDHARRRQRPRLKALRQRAAFASALGFAALLGLAGHHAVNAKHRIVGLQARTAATPSSTRFFDEADSSYAFDRQAARVRATGAEAPQASTDAPPTTPSPVAVTSAS